MLCMGAALKKKNNNHCCKKYCSFSALSVLILRTNIHSNWPKTIGCIVWFPNLEEKTQPKKCRQLCCYFSAGECDRTAPGCICCWRKPHPCGARIWKFQMYLLFYRAATLRCKTSRFLRQNTTFPVLCRSVSTPGSLIQTEKKNNIKTRLSLRNASVQKYCA